MFNKIDDKKIIYVLAKKEYFSNISTLLMIIPMIFFEIMFIINTKQESNIRGIVLFLFLDIFLGISIICLLIRFIYWIVQPNNLILRNESGIYIGRNKRFISFSKIDIVNYKFAITKKVRGNYEKDNTRGTIILILKDKEKIKIRNVAYPIFAADEIYNFKKQRKFR